MSREAVYASGVIHWSCEMASQERVVCQGGPKAEPVTVSRRTVCEGETVKVVLRLCP